MVTAGSAGGVGARATKPAGKPSWVISNQNLVPVPVSLQLLSLALCICCVTACTGVHQVLEKKQFFPKVEVCVLGVFVSSHLAIAEKHLPKVFWWLSDVGLLTGWVGTGVRVCDTGSALASGVTGQRSVSAEMHNSLTFLSFE